MVETAPYTDSPVNLPDPWAVAQGQSVKSISFNVKDIYGQNQSVPVGTSFTGVTTEDLITAQQRDFTSGELATWDDGKPKLQLTAVIATEYRDDEDDDGIRRMYFAAQALRALQDEMREKKIQRFGIGTRITQTLINLKPTAKGFPQKIYKIDLVPAPYISPEQRATDEALNQPTHARVTTPSGQQGIMQTQWQAPASAPAQAAPAAQPQAAAPVAAPVPAAAPAAAVPAGPVITRDQVESVRMVMGAGIDRQTALAGVANQVAPGDASFLQALDNMVGAV